MAALFHSFGRADRLDKNHCMAVDQWILPWLGVGKFHIDRVRVLFVGKTSGSLWMAYDWSSYFRSCPWTTNR